MIICLLGFVIQYVWIIVDFVVWLVIGFVIVIVWVFGLGFGFKVRF